MAGADRPRAAAAPRRPRRRRTSLRATVAAAVATAAAAAATTTPAVVGMAPPAPIRAVLAFGVGPPTLDLNTTAVRADADGSMAASAAQAAGIPDVMELPVMLVKDRVYTTATDLQGSPSRVASMFPFPKLLDLAFRSLAYIYLPLSAGTGGPGSLYRFSLVDGESFDVRVGEGGGGGAPRSPHFPWSAPTAAAWRPRRRLSRACSSVWWPAAPRATPVPPA